MSLAMRPNEVNTEVQYDCKVRHQAVIFLYTEVQNMRKNMTEIVFILDRSGSMSGLETDTIGGFNSMIVILSILVYTFFTRMFDFMLPLVVKYSIVAA